MTSVNKPLIIAFEGGDGAGKGTQTKELLLALRARGFRADTLAFPDYEANTAGKNFVIFVLEAQGGFSIKIFQICHYRDRNAV